MEYSKMISYDSKTQNIIILTNEEKENYYKSVLQDLQITIAKYFTQKLSEQETFLFNFPESEKLVKDKSLFYNAVHKLIIDIKKNEKYIVLKNQSLKFNITNGELKINYEEICGITNYIIAIIDNLKKKKEEIIYNFSFNSIIPNIDIKVKDIKLSKLKEKSSFVKKINVCLSNKNIRNASEIKEKNIIDINVIQLFCLFFKAFFTNLLVVSIDLNIYEINRFFDKEINLYKIKEDEILKYGEKFNNIFLGNLILMKKMTNISYVSFIMYDSYQLELHQLMKKFFSGNHSDENERNKNSIQNNTKKSDNNIFDFQNELLFLLHIVPAIIIEFMELNINFNSLDPLLFSYINIILTRHSKLANITLKFFDFNMVSKRKILLNSYYYNYYSGGTKNPFQTKNVLEKKKKVFDNNYKIYYDNISSISDNENKELFLLKDEVILKELFPYFNYNLNSLLTILDDKLKENKNLVNTLTLDFCSRNTNWIFSNKYNNYSSAIICFLYNFFYVLEENKKNCNLSSLDLLIDDFSDEKEYIITNIKNKVPFYKNSNNLNLNELQLNRIYFNISNISLILPFKNFPMKSLKELIIKNLTYHDLDNFIDAIKNNDNIFNNVTSLEIGLNFMIEDFIEKVKILLKECFLKTITNFMLEIRNIISDGYIIDIIDCVKNNKNNRAKYYLQISNDKLSPVIGNTYFDDLALSFIKNHKSNFHKRNILANIGCKDYKNLFFSLKMLNSEDINYYLNIIYCFNKLYNNNNNIINNNKKRKIFENIFYYIVKFKKKNKEINIEII